MRTSTSLRAAGALFLLFLCGTAAFPAAAEAAVINFSGTVTYDGTHSGDSLYVAVLDTTGTEDVTLLGLEVIPVSAPPLLESYSIDFDNTGLTEPLLVAAFLDVDGGGIGAVTGADVFGWYPGVATPMGISPTASAVALNFGLPKAEIHGTLTFAGGQIEARVMASADCFTEGFRPRADFASGGSYAIIGLYPGTYCISGDANGVKSLHICYGDLTCATPTLVTLTATEVRNGVDLDFSAVSPVDPLGWGSLKARYR